MTEIIELGTVSSRGQIALPSSIRTQLGIEEGSKILFLSDGSTIHIRKMTSETWAELTKPFREMPKKIKEEDVNALIHKLRKE